MTPQEKAARTVREKKERREAEEEAQRNDRRQAITICRAIRDDETAADADRLHAIEILRSM